jgi:hypothetical protein
VAVILELAENANTYQPLGPGEERIVDPRFVVWIGTGFEDPHWTVVQRLRIGTDVESVAAEVRALVRTHGKPGCTWEVGSSATPHDLVDRLLVLGMERDGEPIATGMVLDREPRWPAVSGVTARRVESVDEMETAARIAGTAFGMTGPAIEETVAEARRAFTREGDDGATYLAFVDGRPLARATAAFTDHGVLLFGGATLAEGRGRGAYRALVQARWDDAVARGTPVLVTHAGAMSRPILERLGFAAVSKIEILVDRLEDPTATS